MILGLSLADLASLRSKADTFVSDGIESETWCDLIEINESGEACILELNVHSAAAVTIHGMRIIGPGENVLVQKDDLATLGVLATSLGPRYYVARAHVYPGCIVQVCVTTVAEGEEISGEVYYQTAKKTEKKIVSIFGDGRSPGDPGLVAHASICNSLRRMREELEES